MSRSPQAVAEHYKKRALSDVILAALKAAGKDIEHLTPDDLAPVDEFHSGGRNATVRLAQLAQIDASQRVLDVGCGIGGAPPHLPRKFGCPSTRPRPNPGILHPFRKLAPRHPPPAQWPPRP